MLIMIETAILIGKPYVVVAVTVVVKVVVAVVAEVDVPVRSVLKKRGALLISITLSPLIMTDWLEPKY